jgi:hypothetical protein
MSGLSSLEFLKLAIFYASWLYFPAAAILAAVILRAPARMRALAAAALLALSVLAYARFVEPHLLLRTETRIELRRCVAAAGSLKIALVSDIHAGLFANAVPPARLAAAIRDIGPDLAMIAGDSTYFLDPARFDAVFAPLGMIGAPVFAVMGNHDVGIPGPDVSAPLTASFERVGVRVIENARVEAVAGVEIVGLSDRWQGRQQLGLLVPRTDRPRLVLTHNPKTVDNLGDDMHVDLLLAGHTHGGQIYLPFITCRLIAIACAPIRRGYAEIAGHQLFVTSGVGMVGLPMRFLAPPRIDVLDVRFRACGGPR